MVGAGEVGVVLAKAEAKRCSVTSAAATASVGIRGIGGVEPILACQLAIHSGVTAKCGRRTGGAWAG